MSTFHLYAPDFTLVAIESPYGGDVERNLTYARKCMADSIKRGEAPIASHLLYTQPGILNDDIPAERALGIECGFAWGQYADFVAVYTDLGISKGMRLGIENYEDQDMLIVYRTLEAGSW